MKLDNHGYAQYTKEEIIELVKKYYNNNGRIVIRDLRHKNGLPSVNQVINLFGSFQQCLIESNIDINIEDNNLFNREQLSKEEIQKRYVKFVEVYLKSHLFLPTSDEIDKEKTLPVSGTIILKFGSLDELNRLIGYDTKEFNNEQLENDMLKSYKSACDDFGYVLSSRDITRLSKSGYKIYSTEAYFNHFSSLANLQKICGFYPTVIGKNITKAESIDGLKKLSEILGRNPVCLDLKLYDFVPGQAYYNHEFGSFQEAKRIAGLSEYKRLRTKNGTKCNSTFELKLAQMLEHYGITYRNEIMYKDVIPNFKRLYRFDFLIELHNKKYYIELFGITGNEKYHKRKKEKIKLCKDYNIPLIQFYQKDLFSKSNSEIYETLLNRINEIEKKIA